MSLRDVAPIAVSAAPGTWLCVRRGKPHPARNGRLTCPRAEDCQTWILRQVAHLWLTTIKTAPRFVPLPLLRITTLSEWSSPSASVVQVNPAPPVGPAVVGARWRPTAERRGGATQVTVMLGFVAASGAALLAVGPRLLDDRMFAGLAIEWTVSTIFGLGVAAPTEQLVNRRLNVDPACRRDRLRSASERRPAWLWCL